MTLQIQSSVLIECEQQLCTYFEPRGVANQRLAPSEAAYLPDSDGNYYKAIYHYPNIPGSIHKKWRYLHKFTELIRAKTPKVSSVNLIPI